MAAIAAPDAAPSSADKRAAVPANPFTKAARRKAEQFWDVTQVLGTSAVQLPQIDVPAAGYLRHIVIDVNVTGTTAATYAADAPWNVIDQISLSDVNGQPLLLLSGYDLFLANLLGGYSQNADPRKSPRYVAPAATGFRFQLRVPVEIIQRNAFGALQNLNGAMQFKLKVSLAPIVDVFPTNTGTPSVRIIALAEHWSNPPAADLAGRPNETMPPAAGTTQNWTSNVQTVNSGANTHRLPRVGNQLRNIILVARNGAGARSDAVLPSEIGLYFDGNQWFKVPTDYVQKQRMHELYGYVSADIPTGVIVLPFTDDFDGTPGEEMGDYYVGTSGATRLEFQASWLAAGTVKFITNDILAFAGNGGAGATLGAQA